MRKSLFLTLVLSLCMVDCGAFAATTPSRGNSRGSQASAPVAARAASRQKVASGDSNGAGTARVASRQVATTPMVSVLSNNSVTAARAATQKALNMGTKVAVATENTVIDEACQNDLCKLT